VINHCSTIRQSSQAHYLVEGTGEGTSSNIYTNDTI